MTQWICMGLRAKSNRIKFVSDGRLYHRTNFQCFVGHRTEVIEFFVLLFGFFCRKRHLGPKDSPVAQFLCILGQKIFNSKRLRMSPSTSLPNFSSIGSGDPEMNMPFLAPWGAGPGGGDGTPEKGGFASQKMCKKCVQNLVLLRAF